MPAVECRSPVHRPQASGSRPLNADGKACNTRLDLPSSHVFTCIGGSGHLAEKNAV